MSEATSCTLNVDVLESNLVYQITTYKLIHINFVYAWVKNEDAFADKMCKWRNLNYFILPQRLKLITYVIVLLDNVSEI